MKYRFLCFNLSPFASSKMLIFLILNCFAQTIFASDFLPFLETRDQRGARLFKAGEVEKAAQTFKNKSWRAVASFRASHYEQALALFKNQKDSDGQYNAGNAAAYLGKYAEAIHFYDQAIALNANNQDAIANKEIIKKLISEKQQNNSSSTANKKEGPKKEADNKQEGAGDNKKESAANNKPDKDQSKPQAKEAEKNQQKEGQGAASSNTHTANATKENSEKPDGRRQETAQASEDQNQILRRVQDDPGGLLKQKFLRDYLRRHAAQNDGLEAGEND